MRERKHEITCREVLEKSATGDWGDTSEGTCSIRVRGYLVETTLHGK